MLACWSPAAQRLEPLSAWAGQRWVHASAPTEAERARLTGELGVPESFLAHALDLDEVARLDREGGVTLVMLRVPWVGATADLPFRTVPLAVVVLGERVVTVTLADDAVVTRLGLGAGLTPERPARFILQLLDRAAARYLADVRDINLQVDAVEAKLETSLRNAEVLQLLSLQKGLVHFETALASNHILLERLQRDERLPKHPEDHELLEDVAIELRQASEMVRISADILSQTMDAFASIISNNLNGVMKLLTSLTLLIAIPTAVASFFGMNVKLPLATHPMAFELTVLLSVALLSLVGVLFRRWRWL